MLKNVPRGLMLAFLRPNHSLMAGCERLMGTGRLILPPNRDLESWPISGVLLSISPLNWMSIFVSSDSFNIAENKFVSLRSCLTERWRTHWFLDFKIEEKREPKQYERLEKEYLFMTSKICLPVNVVKCHSLSASSQLSTDMSFSSDFHHNLWWRWCRRTRHRPGERTIRSLKWATALIPRSDEMWRTWLDCHFSLVLLFSDAIYLLLCRRNIYSN